MASSLISGYVSDYLGCSSVVPDILDGAGSVRASPEPEPEPEPQPKAEPAQQREVDLGADTVVLVPATQQSVSSNGSALQTSQQSEKTLFIPETPAKANNVSPAEVTLSQSFVARSASIGIDSRSSPTQDTSNNVTVDQPSSSQQLTPAASDVEDTPAAQVLSKNQRRRLRKRELRTSERQSAHERRNQSDRASSAAPSAQTKPESQLQVTVVETPMAKVSRPSPSPPRPNPPASQPAPKDSPAFANGHSPAPRTTAAKNVPVRASGSFTIPAMSPSRTEGGRSVCRRCYSFLPPNDAQFDYVSLRDALESNAHKRLSVIAVVATCSEVKTTRTNGEAENAAREVSSHNLCQNSREYCI